MADHDDRYRLPGGHPVPSVSTILRTCYGGDEVAHWANRLGLEGRSYHRELGYRAQVGTLAHWYVEASLGLPSGPPPGLDTGSPADDDIGASLAHDCARRLLEWWAAEGLGEIVCAEQVMIHPVMLYGGTADLVARDGDRQVVIDWKTSSAPTRRHRLQVGAYCALVEAVTGIDTYGLVVCAPLAGGPVKVSKVDGDMKRRMIAAFGYLRLAYKELSREKWPTEGE